ncbi:MAG: hypothetical protein K0U39_09655 [Alphaproteobacteria bacterium]|nr:hypothetical protein [Alphaproteobacteria bacterium]
MYNSNMSNDTQNDKSANNDAQNDARNNALASALTIATKSANAKPVHLNKKTYVMSDFFDEIKADYHAENNRYMNRYIKKYETDPNHYHHFSSPVRDHRNAALVMWHTLGKYADKQACNKDFIDKFFAKARKCGIIALENKFTTIIS